MDRVTFDALTARVAQQSTRRGALAALVGGVLLIAGPSSGEATERAQRRKRRRRHQRAQERNAQNQNCGASGPCAAGQVCTCVCPPGQDCSCPPHTSCNPLSCPGNGIEVCLDTFGCQARNDFCGDRPSDTACPGNPNGTCVNVGPQGKQSICVSNDHGLAICRDTLSLSCQECTALGYSLCVAIPPRRDGRCCYGEIGKARICVNPAPPREV